MKTIHDLMSMEGRCALITGASGGIGKQIATAFADLGADLILVDRPKTDYSELRVVIETQFGASVEYIDCDLEDGHARSELVRVLHLLVDGGWTIW